HFYAEAFSADPARANSLRNGDRRNASRAAALAGCGRSKDDPPPDDATRAGLRAQALGWMKADLALWARPLEAGTDATRTEVRKTLTQWRNDLDFSGIRDADALAKLPEAECKDWQSLWAEVEILLARARGDRP